MKAFVAVSSLLGLAAADPIYAPIAPVLAKPYPSWPGVVAPGFESTCYGCGLGKRSADAEPEAWAPWGLWGPGIAAHPTGISYSNRSPQGLGKRSAEPWAPVWGPGIAAHPGPAISYSNRSPQGAYGKRSAGEETPAKALHPNGATSYVGETVWGYPVKAVEKRDAEPWAPWGLWGRGIAAHPTGISYSNRSPQGLGKRSAEPWAPVWGPGIAAHPGPAISYSNRSPQGAYGKRSAEPLGYGLGYAYGVAPGVNAHPTGVSYSSVRLGKRDAEPALLAPALPKAYPSWPGVVAPGFESTCFGCGLGKREAGEETPAKALHPNGGTSYVGETVWGFPLKAVEKREAEPLAISYSNRSPQGAYGWGPAPYIWG